MDARAVRASHQEARAEALAPVDVKWMKRLWLCSTSAEVAHVCNSKISMEEIKDVAQ